MVKSNPGEPYSRISSRESFTIVLPHLVVMTVLWLPCSIETTVSRLKSISSFVSEFVTVIKCAILKFLKKSGEAKASPLMVMITTY